MTNLTQFNSIHKQTNTNNNNNNNNNKQNDYIHTRRNCDQQQQANDTSCNNNYNNNNLTNIINKQNIHQSHRQQFVCKRKECAKTSLIAATCLAATLITLLLRSSIAEAASARVNMHQVSRQTNQYFLNEFCDLESKTLRSAKKLKQASDTHSLFLTSKNTLSSVRVLPQKQQIPSSISFGFGSSASQPTAAPIFKQLNCSIIVVAPKSHGLLVTVNSIGLPKNLTKLGIILNHDSAHAQHVHLEGETTSANYLLTQPSSSKIAINLQSFQPIDWSHVSFDILFTVYKKANSTGCPNKKWFDCGDNICVPSSLVCDNNRNCPNGNDEMIFYRCYSPLFWSIAASTALALILVILITSVILIVRRRRLSEQQRSFSNNVLASEGDLMHDNNSSKLDLTQESAARSSSYLASNLYLGGFENPVWTNGTLTKQHSIASNNQTISQQQHLLDATTTTTTTTTTSTNTDLPARKM